MRIAGLVGMAALAETLVAGNAVAVHGIPVATPDATVYVDNAGGGFYLTKVLASRMLAAAGVEVTWRIGEPKPDPAGGLVVRVRFTDTPSPGDQKRVLAEAHPFGGDAGCITVFHDRILAIAERSGTEEYKVTAHVLVHEIGHVLERIDGHSDAGVMKAHWTLTDFQAMGLKPLAFTEEDIAWIHRTLEHLRKQSRSGANK